ncbi:MAG: YcaO-like family protein, partial [Methanomicrobium sp.]|nr:YcaO-like family protein [Methanomicrobium sp.]
LTQIHGAREDTTEAEFRKQIGYDRTKRLNRKWFAVPESKDDMRNFADIPRFEADYGNGVCDFSKELTYISEKLQSCGTKHIFAARLSTLDADIEVVRVIVPGLESFAIDNQRMGERCRNARRNRFSGAKSQTE